MFFSARDFVPSPAAAKAKTMARMEDVELTQWLKEAGQRRGPAPRPPAAPQGPQPAQPAATPVPRRWLLLALLGALASLPYTYVDTQVQIAKLPALIIFILTQAKIGV